MRLQLNLLWITQVVDHAANAEFHLIATPAQPCYSLFCFSLLLFFMVFGLSHRYISYIPKGMNRHVFMLQSRDMTSPMNIWFYIFSSTCAFLDNFVCLSNLGYMPHFITFGENEVGLSYTWKSLFHKHSIYIFILYSDFWLTDFYFIFYQLLCSFKLFFFFCT